jgi:sulfatase maturation enzyme AslB (radical SAM superfamily)
MRAEPWPLESLFLILTSACNLRCTYCYNSRASAARMAWPTVEAAVARLWASGERDVHLLITGGEPLLEFPLVRRVIEHARATKPRGRAVAFQLLTNGTRLGEEQIAFLARRRVSVQISFDGVESAQRLRGAWTYPRLEALITHVRRRHRGWFERRVSAAATLTPETIPHLADSIEYLTGLGFVDVAVAPAYGDVRGWHDGLIPLLDAQFGRLYRSSLRHYRRTGLVPFAAFRKGAAQRLSPAHALCGVETGHMATVDVDGQVYGCAMVAGSALDRPTGLLRSARDAMRIGTVTDPGLAGGLPGYRDALAATGLFGRRDRNRSSYGACRDCAYLRYCSVCPLSIALAPGASDPRRVPDFICAFARVSMKYRHRFPRQADA